MSTFADSDSSYDFSALSIRDLVEARDLHHFHLMSKANVVGTAVGLYLIRKDEDWPTSRIQDAGRTSRDKKTYSRALSTDRARSVRPAAGIRHPRPSSGAHSYAHLGLRRQPRRR